MLVWQLEVSRLKAWLSYVWTPYNQEDIGNLRGLAQKLDLAAFQGFRYWHKVSDMEFARRKEKPQKSTLTLKDLGL
jgi:hypothetical protein